MTCACDSALALSTNNKEQSRKKICVNHRCVVCSDINTNLLSERGTHHYNTILTLLIILCSRPRDVQSSSFEEDVEKAVN